MDLKTLTEINAPSGHEQPIRRALLAEAAAEEIEANAVLARAGALFHDIGKIKNPEYFIENNQTGSNPHDKLNPRMSSLIISNHVKDGLDMAKDFLRRSSILVVCGSTVDETVKNDIATAEQLRIAATTLDGILTVKGQGRRDK